MHSVLDRAGGDGGVPRGLDRVSQGSTRFDSVRHVTGRRCRPTGLSRRAAIPLHAYLPTSAGGTMGTPYALIGRPPGLLVHGAKSSCCGQRRVGVAAPSCFPSFWGSTALRVWPEFSLTGSGLSGRRGAKASVWQPPCAGGCRFPAPMFRARAPAARRSGPRSACSVPAGSAPSSPRHGAAARGYYGGDNSRPR